MESPDDVPRTEEAPMIADDAPALEPSDDPPSVAELAARTQLSTPAPEPSQKTGDRLAPDVAPIIDSVPGGALQCPFDSITPTTLDSRRGEGQREDDPTPVPFYLTNRRSSSVWWGLRPTLDRRQYYVLALAGLALLACIIVATRVPLSSAPRAERYSPMTPAQAASWAAAPFTVEVPLESASEPTRSPVEGTSNGRRAAAHIDLESAVAALAEAKASLAECEPPDDAASSSTNSSASLTFSRNGRVTRVVINPPVETTAIADCVMDRLRAVRIAPFSGRSVTVRTTFTLPGG